MNPETDLAFPCSIVKTHLWTDSDEKMARFGISDDISIPTETVADVMLDLIQQGKYPGGTVLELRRAGARVIKEWENETPEELKAELPKEFIEHNIAPLRAIMDGYRKGGK